jgi:hypothetical protein
MDGDQGRGRGRSDHRRDGCTGNIRHRVGRLSERHGGKDGERHGLGADVDVDHEHSRSRPTNLPDRDRSGQPEHRLRSDRGVLAENLWKTVDGGVTWTSTTGSGVTGIPNVPVHDLEIESSNTLSL